MRPVLGFTRFGSLTQEVNGTYNLYTYWRERKDALKLWHAKLEGLKGQEALEAA